MSFTIDAGSSFTASGTLAVDDDGDGKLEGHLRLALPIEHDGDAYEISATPTLQVCDAL